MTRRMLFLLCGLVLSATAAAQQAVTLHLEKEIPLAGVTGRLDHFAVDMETNRVFVAALGNGTVEVVDLNAGRRIGQIKGLKEPQGLLYLYDVLYVASGGDGTVRSFDGHTLSPLKTVTLGDDADNLRIDPDVDRIEKIFAGYGSGAIAELGLDLKRLADIPLPSHPESFHASNDGRVMFVNLPGNGSVARVDLETRKVDANWAHPGAKANFPMWLYNDDGWLFVACRNPARLVSLNALTGKVVDTIPTVGDADDLFYDQGRQLLFVIGGEGFVDVVKVAHDEPRMTSVAHVATAPGARTGIYLGEANKLLVAAPQRAGHETRLLVYAVSPR